MFCSKCGALVEAGAKFCPACGAAQEEKTVEYTAPVPVQPVNYQEPAWNDRPVKQVSFIDAVKSFFVHYADFKGRSTRAEYWWVTLFNFLVSTLVTAIIPDLAFLWSLAVLVPGIAICVRRLHDAGKSGWYYLLCLIPVVGFILVLVQLCKPSQPDNQWGPFPAA